MHPNSWVLPETRAYGSARVYGGPNREGGVGVRAWPFLPDDIWKSHGIGCIAAGSMTYCQPGTDETAGAEMLLDAADETGNDHQPSRCHSSPPGSPWRAFHLEARMEDEDTREARRREIRATIRCALIVLGISAGAFLVASIISGCQVPQVCKHCWVAK